MESLVRSEPRDQRRQREVAVRGVNEEQAVGLEVAKIDVERLACEQVRGDRVAGAGRRDSLTMGPLCIENADGGR